MASLGGTYDASQGEQMSDRSALPAGEYLAAIARSDVSDTKKGDGRKVELEFEVLDGAHKGRRFWTTLNLWNPSATTVEMAQRELNSICHAAGRLRVADTEELHGIPMLVKLGFQKDNPERNEPKGYKPAAGVAASSAGPGARERRLRQARAVGVSRTLGEAV
ncbi:DUF669 domain-containing protein [uncultured Amaricoccus sp.]|uniref:DUF669 domain-containing protein n=1 Tax=uncultured Amaricoccus sp. TaxID=339341 RepID=UPI00260D33DA|nr:DUF669 domain-containing protein [uncultured Amaricoccus sp.]